MKKSALTLNDFRKNELPKKHCKMINGGQDPTLEENIETLKDLLPPGTVKPIGQT